MAAHIIPFPSRQPAEQKSPYAFLEVHARQWLAQKRAIEATQPTKAVATEDEIITLLRRIDRRLAKMSAA